MRLSVVHFVRCTGYLSLSFCKQQLPTVIIEHIFQLEFFEVSELSFAQDLIKGKEGMVKKLAGGDQKRTGLFKCIARGFRFIWSCVAGYVL